MLYIKYYHYYINYYVLLKVKQYYFYCNYADEIVFRLSISLECNIDNISNN